MEITHFCECMAHTIIHSPLCELTTMQMRNRDLRIHRCRRDRQHLRPVSENNQQIRLFLPEICAKPAQRSRHRQSDCISIIHTRRIIFCVQNRDPAIDRYIVPLDLLNRISKCSFQMSTRDNHLCLPLIACQQTTDQRL